MVVFFVSGLMTELKQRVDVLIHPRAAFQAEFPELLHGVLIRLGIAAVRIQGAVFLERVAPHLKVTLCRRPQILHHAVNIGRQILVAQIGIAQLP